jgi:hypothetical protein
MGGLGVTMVDYTHAGRDSQLTTREMTIQVNQLSRGFALVADRT